MMSTRALKLAKPFFKLIPDEVHSRLLAATCNHLKRGLEIERRLGEIDGKAIRIHVTDVPMCYQLAIRNGSLRPIAKDRADATISGTLVDFWMLATRSEDPDTLFFNRRLVIEGDTEVGLHIKNLLDGLEFDWRAHFEAVTGRRPPAFLDRALSSMHRRFVARRDHKENPGSVRNVMPGSPYQ